MRWVPTSVPGRTVAGLPPHYPSPLRESSFFRSLDVPDMVALKGRFNVNEKYAFKILSHCI